MLWRDLSFVTDNLVDADNEFEKVSIHVLKSLSRYTMLPSYYAIVQS
jgi:hypothetical protein